MRPGAQILIAPLESRHWDAVARIYCEGLATGNAAFETRAPSWEDWDRGYAQELRFVALRDDEVVGWAALAPVSDRCTYGGVAECSVYVAQAARGQGVGRSLLAELIVASESAGIWTIQAGVFPENQASLRLHAGAGFRVIGTRERLGKRDDVWRDVVFLERRSPNVG